MTNSVVQLELYGASTDHQTIASLESGGASWNQRKLFRAFEDSHLAEWQENETKEFAISMNAQY